MNPPDRDQIAVASADDPFRSALIERFCERGFLVRTCKTWGELVSTSRQARLRLITLRGAIDDISALQAGLRLRWYGVRTPLLLLDHAPTPEQTIRAARLGASALVAADDLHGAFRYAEAMIARQQAAGMSSIRRGPFLVDLAKRHVWIDGTRIALTLSQARICAFLCLHANTVVRIDELVVEIAGLIPTESSRKAMAQQVFRLRAKLGSWRDCIQTLRGFGYRLDVLRSPGTKM